MCFMSIVGRRRCIEGGVRSGVGLGSGLSSGLGVVPVWAIPTDGGHAASTSM